MRRLLAIALIVAACGGSTTGSSPTAAPSATAKPAPASVPVQATGLLDTVWQVTVLALAPPFCCVIEAVQAADYTIEFVADGTFTAKAGCNTVDGTYTTTDPTRASGDLTITPMTVRIDPDGTPYQADPSVSGPVASVIATTVVCDDVPGAFTPSGLSQGYVLGLSHATSYAVVDGCVASGVICTLTIKLGATDASLAYKSLSDRPTVQATARESRTSDALPDGWTRASWSDPDLEIGLPGDWQKGDPTQTLAPAATEAIGSFTPEQLDAIDRLNRVIEWGNEMASSGNTRLSSYGNVERSLGAFDGFVGVYIESGDASVEAFTNRELTLLKGLFGINDVDQSTVDLVAGPAVRLAYSGEAWGGDAGITHYSEVDYLFTLPDGRSMTVAVSGSAEPSEISAFAAMVIATLRPT